MNKAISVPRIGQVLTVNEPGLKFLTLQEAANLVRVSLKTVQRWRLLAQIRVHKAGRRVLVLESQLLDDLGIDPMGVKSGLAAGQSVGCNQGARGRS